MHTAFVAVYTRALQRTLQGKVLICLLSVFKQVGIYSN